jgi:hypothetical protein
MNKAVFLLLKITPLLLLTAGDAFARAGGAGGGGGGMNSLKFKLGLGIIAFIYAAIHAAVVTSKGHRSDELLEKVAARDRSWSPATLMPRVRQVFDTVQRAWMQRDQELARDCMSEALYLKHKKLTDEMIRDHERNILRQIKLDELRVVGIDDYEDDAQDSFCVYVSGSMIDYTIDDRTEYPIKGSVDDPESFYELWTFVRGPQGWVVDEIEPHAGILAISGLRNYSEDLGRGEITALQGNHSTTGGS